ncbi:hypothetical protein [Pseudonocardia sp.]|uniref:hypothetical protein n=1 Tax=Pseudonocardia sp. TaxID=60912 RepID=UPI003D122CB2
MVDAVDTWRSRWPAAAGRARGSLAGRLVLRFVAASGYDRALALATQAFVGLVPAAMLAAGVLSGDPTSAQHWLVARLDLGEQASQAVNDLTRIAPVADPPSVVVATVLVVVTGLGFTRTLQRLYVAAWALRPLGVRGYLQGLLGVLVLVGGIAAGIAWRHGNPATATVHVVTTVLLWLPVQRLLLGDRVTLRQLLPGAVLVGVGQAMLTLFAAPFLRAAVVEHAARYGAIGVAFVLVSWLLLLSYLLVGAAVLSAELAGAPVPGVRPGDAY